MAGAKTGSNDLITDLPRIAIITVVFIFPVFLGQLGMLRLLTPLPIFYFLLTAGWQKGNALIIKGVIAAGIISLVLGHLPEYIVSCTLLPVGYVLAKAALETSSMSKAGFNAAVALAATWCISVFVVGIYTNTNPYSETLAVIDKIIASSSEIYQQSTDTSAETAFQIEKAIEQIRQIIPVIFPALLMITVVTTVWINILIGIWLLKKHGGMTPCQWTEYSLWRLPDQLVWVVIAAGIGLLLPAQPISHISLNLILVLCTLYFFQGMAILTYYLAKWAVPKPFRYFIYLLVCIQAYGMLFLAFAGLLDVWFDFRKKQQETT
jgi:uncharacterized protein YybS (DUF2232 family)